MIVMILTNGDVSFFKKILITIKKLFIKIKNMIRLQTWVKL